MTREQQSPTDEQSENQLRKIAKQNARQLLAGYEEDAETQREQVRLALEQVEADHQQAVETIREAQRMAEQISLTHRILTQLHDEHLYVEQTASEIADELDSQRDNGTDRQKPTEKPTEKSAGKDTGMAELNDAGIANSVAQNALIGRSNEESDD